MTKMRIGADAIMFNGGFHTGSVFLNQPARQRSHGALATKLNLNPASIENTRVYYSSKSQ